MPASKESPNVSLRVSCRSLRPYLCNGGTIQLGVFESLSNVLQVALEGLLVCGGGSSPPGLGLRLLRDLRQMLPPSFSPGLIQAPEYAPSGTLKHSVFIGGAIVAKVTSCRWRRYL